MIFKIKNTKESRSLIEDYPILSTHGYSNEEKGTWGSIGDITINSIEELISLTKDINKEIIITTDYGDDVPWIEIYDYWRE